MSIKVANSFPLEWLPFEKGGKYYHLRVLLISEMYLYFLRETDTRTGGEKLKNFSFRVDTFSEGLGVL